jgi:competence protein ComEC
MGVVCLLLVLAIVATPAIAGSRGPLTVTVLDVGDGDAVFVRTPGGKTMLIDGGPNPSGLLSEIGRRLGPLEREISVAILTGADQARLAGAVAATERYSIGLALTAPERSPSALAERWYTGVGGRAIFVDEPTTVTLEPGVEVELLPTGAVAVNQGNPPLQRTLLVRITAGTVSYLVGPSLTPEAARALSSDGLDLAADVLIVPRQGDGRGLDAGTLARIDPALAIIPVGTRSRGLPSTEVLGLLRDIPAYRTDRYGSIELRTDGARVWLTPERVPNEAA